MFIVDPPAAAAPPPPPPPAPPAAVVWLPPPAAVVWLPPPAAVVWLPPPVSPVCATPPPCATLLKDGGTSSISGLNSGGGGNPYCSCSHSCCLSMTCVEKSGPWYPIVTQSKITAANEMPITSIPKATPRICGV